MDPAWRMSLVRVQDEYTAALRPLLLALLGAATFMLLIAAGLLAAAGLSLALRRVLGSQLHGVSPTDPVSFAAIAALLAAAAAAATAVPARRAARTDPAQVLRGE